MSKLFDIKNILVVGKKTSFKLANFSILHTNLDFPPKRPTFKKCVILRDICTELSKAESFSTFDGSIEPVLTRKPHNSFRQHMTSPHL